MEYRSAHIEEKKISDKIYRDTHTKENKIYKEQYRKDNKVKLQKKASKYYNENKDTMYVKVKQRLKLNIVQSREYFKGYVQHRRANAAGLVHDFTKEQWSSCKEHFNNKCVYCGRPMERLEQDHFIPLTNAGGYTKNNILCACRGCNASKGDKCINDWYPIQEFYNKERLNRILEYLNTSI